MQKKYSIVITLFIAALLFLTGFAMKTAQATPVFSFAEQPQKCVYLTFDDGPSTVVTNRILDILQKEGVKATFFVVGEQIEGREETLRRIAAEGHTIGVHSETHRYDIIYSSDDALLRDVRDCAEHIRAVTGITPCVYRFPGGGVRRPAQRKLIEQQGYKVVEWNAGCGDEEIPNASAERLVKESINSSKGRNTVIFLSHDSPHHKATAEALPEIIQYFREQGFVFCAF